MRKELLKSKLKKMNGWEKTGWDVKPRIQNIYGKKGSNEVVWIDNWDKGNWAVIKGIETDSGKHNVKYKEESIYSNSRTKSEALKDLKEILKNETKLF